MFDLTDKVVKDLYDFYEENQKNDFEGAYLYMKYLHEAISMMLSNIMGTPEIPDTAKLDPEVRKKIEALLSTYAEAREGGPDTSLYHSKIVRLENAKQLVTQKLDVSLDVPETIVPFKLARNVILKNPDSIAVGTCPCRLTNPESSCMPDPMEACLFLGDPHTSFIVEHNPRFRRIKQDEAVGILEDCHKRGFVQCAYFKVDLGRRMYAICNCCDCCCPSIKGANLLFDQGARTTSMAPSGLVAQNSEDCVGCGECVETCPFHAISLNDDEGVAEFNLERCMGCGVCVDQCPTEAITLRMEPLKGGVLDIEDLKESVQS